MLTQPWVCRGWVRRVVYCAVFTMEANGRRIVTGGHDQCICVWETETGASNGSGRVQGGSWGARTEGEGRKQGLRSALAGLLLQKMDTVHRSYVLGLAVRHDGLQFASASGDRSVGVWRALPISLFQQCWMETSMLAVTCWDKSKTYFSV